MILAPLTLEGSADVEVASRARRSLRVSQLLPQRREVARNFETLKLQERSHQVVENKRRLRKKRTLSRPNEAILAGP